MTCHTRQVSMNSRNYFVSYREHIMDITKDYFLWITESEEQRKWASTYLSKRSIFVSVCYIPLGSTAGKATTFSERLNQQIDHHSRSIPVDKKKLSADMRTAWRKWKERKVKIDFGIKQYSFSLNYEANKYINTLAKKEKKTRSEVIENLIFTDRNFEKELRSKTKQRLESHAKRTKILNKQLDAYKIQLTVNQNRIASLEDEIKNLQEE